MADNYLAANPQMIDHGLAGLPSDNYDLTGLHSDDYGLDNYDLVGLHSDDHGLVG